MRILFATDFSTSAETAYALVKAMTLPRGSEVRLVHAVEPVPTIATFAPAAMLTMSETAQDDMRSDIRAAARTLVAPGVTADGVVRVGRAADVIIDECFSFGPDLLVVGSRGRGGLATNILGSVSAEVVDRAPCPVLIARSGSLSRIVLAEDGSGPAAAAADALTDLPIFAGADVHVVSVVDASFPLLMPDPTTVRSALDGVRAFEESLVALRARHASLARSRAETLALSGLHATWEQREGDAAVQLIAAARERRADCIVSGSRGHSGLRRLFLGSVARGVLLHAPCSVLITHAATAGRVASTAVGHHLTESPAR